MEGENNQNTEQEPKAETTAEQRGFSTRFSSTNQPKPENKKAGHAIARFNREVIRTMMQNPLSIDWESETGKQLINKFGDRVKTTAAGVLMTEAQMIKAMQGGDTYAFNSVTDHGFGRPVQAIAPSNTDGEPLPQIMLGVPIGLNIQLPSNTEGTGKDEEEAQ